MSAQVYSVPDQTEGGREVFLEWTSIYLSSKLSLTCGGNVNYYKSVHHSIPTVSVAIWNTWVSTGIFSSWLKWRAEGEKKTFFGGCKKGYHIVRLSPRAFGCHERWKTIPFCETWNNPTPPLFFSRPPYK